MGWLSDCWSSVKSAVSSAYNTAKEYAGKAIGWMAEKAEGFVNGVKQVWKTVKPYVEIVRAGLRAAAVATKAIPWLSASHYTHLPTLYPIVLSDDHTERADELGEAGV